MIYRVTFEDEEHNAIKEVTLAADNLVEALWMVVNSTEIPPGAEHLDIERIPPEASGTGAQA